MALLQVVFRQYRWPFIGVIVLTLLSAALGIGLIAYINNELIVAVNTSLTVLPGFLVQLVVLMAVTLASQLALTSLAISLSGDCAANLSSVSSIPALNASSNSAVRSCWRA